ncbi:MAG: hypothetical protein Q9168_008134, partial [Polycauliona sp. 1 TL-2023]
LLFILALLYRGRQTNNPLLPHFFRRPGYTPLADGDNNDPPTHNHNIDNHGNRVQGRIEPPYTDDDGIPHEADEEDFATAEEEGVRVQGRRGQNSARDGDMAVQPSGLHGGGGGNEWRI